MVCTPAPAVAGLKLAPLMPVPLNDPPLGKPVKLIDDEVKHTGEAIKDLVSLVLNEFDLNPNNIIGVSKIISENFIN